MNGRGALQEHAALLAQLRAELLTAAPERRAQIMRELEALGVRSTAVTHPEEAR